MILVIILVLFSQVAVIGNVDDLAILHQLKLGDHVIMITNYLTSYSLASLYLIDHNIPWYSIFLFLVFITGFTVKFFELSKINNYNLIILFFLVSVGALWSINITSLTVYLTFCGISQNMTKRHILVLLFSALLRVELFIFSLVFFYLLICGLRFKQIKSIIPALALALFHYIFVNVDSSYKNFLEDNYARFLVLDQPRVSYWRDENYDEKASAAIYSLIYSWYLLDPRILESLHRAKYHLKQNELFTIDNMKKALQQNSTMLFAISVLVLILCLYSNDKRSLIGILTAVSILVLLLFVRDRQRVTIPLLGCSVIYLCSLVYIAQASLRNLKSKYTLKYGITFLLTIIINLALYYDALAYNKTSSFVQWTGCYETNNKMRKKLIKAVNKYPNEKVVLSVRLPYYYANSLPALCRNLYDESLYGSSNFILGGWTIFSPSAQKQIRQPFNLSDYLFVTNKIDQDKIGKFINFYRKAYKECYETNYLPGNNTFSFMRFNSCK